MSSDHTFTVELRFYHSVLPRILTMTNAELIFIDMDPEYNY